ncbi:MAG: class I lanthipeptide [Caldilineaceae bacterium]
MQPKLNRKLTLSRETLCVLTRSELQRIAGGANQITRNPDPFDPVCHFVLSVNDICTHDNCGGGGVVSCNMSCNNDCPPATMKGDNACNAGSDACN